MKIEEVIRRLRCYVVQLHQDFNQNPVEPDQLKGVQPLVFTRGAAALQQINSYLLARIIGSVYLLEYLVHEEYLNQNTDLFKLADPDIQGSNFSPFYLYLTQLMKLVQQGPFAKVYDPNISCDAALVQSIFDNEAVQRDLVLFFNEMSLLKQSLRGILPDLDNLYDENDEDDETASADPIFLAIMHFTEQHGPIFRSIQRNPLSVGDLILVLSNYYQRLKYNTIPDLKAQTASPERLQEAQKAMILALIWCQVLDLMLSKNQIVYSTNMMELAWQSPSMVQVIGLIQSMGVKPFPVLKAPDPRSSPYQQYEELSRKLFMQLRANSIGTAELREAISEIQQRYLPDSVIAERGQASRNLRNLTNTRTPCLYLAVVLRTHQHPSFTAELAEGANDSSELRQRIMSRSTKLLRSARVQDLVSSALNADSDFNEIGHNEDLTLNQFMQALSGYVRQLNDKLNTDPAPPLTTVLEYSHARNKAETYYHLIKFWKQYPQIGGELRLSRHYLKNEFLDFVKEMKKIGLSLELSEEPLRDVTDNLAVQRIIGIIVRKVGVFLKVEKSDGAKGAMMDMQHDYFLKATKSLSAVLRSPQVRP